MVIIIDGLYINIAHLLPCFSAIIKPESLTLKVFCCTF